MKKRISLALTVLLVLSVCVLPFATHAAENAVAQQNLTPDQCKQQGHPLPMPLLKNPQPTHLLALLSIVKRNTMLNVVTVGFELNIIPSRMYMKHTQFASLFPAITTGSIL